jgi:hypothetical protein
VRWAIVAALVAASACGGDGDAATGPSPLGGRLTEGEAEVVVVGGLEAEFVAPLDPDAPNIFQPPDGGFALNWSDQSSQGFGVGGPLYMGTRETDQELSLSITLVEDELPVVFSSFDGECIVGITTVGDDAISGSFECTGLVVGDTTIDAEGRFTASG